MDALSSTEFRKRFARLTSPTVVTVNGHPIGEWTPVSHSRYVTLQEAKATIAEVRRDVDHFNSRPFTPVPKR